MNLQLLPEQVKSTLDGISLATAVGVVMDYIPAMAGIVSVIYTVLRIYEYVKNKRLLDEKHCACCGTDLKAQNESRFRDTVAADPDERGDHPREQVRRG